MEIDEKNDVESYKPSKFLAYYQHSGLTKAKLTYEVCCNEICIYNARNIMFNFHNDDDEYLKVPLNNKKIFLGSSGGATIKTIKAKSCFPDEASSFKILTKCNFHNAGQFVYGFDNDAISKPYLKYLVVDNGAKKEDFSYKCPMHGNNFECLRAYLYQKENVDIFINGALVDIPNIRFLNRPICFNIVPGSNFEFKLQLKKKSFIMKMIVTNYNIEEAPEDPFDEENEIFYENISG